MIFQDFVSHPVYIKIENIPQYILTVWIVCVLFCMLFVYNISYMPIWECNDCHIICCFCSCHGDQAYQFYRCRQNMQNYNIFSQIMFIIYLFQFRYTYNDYLDCIELDWLQLIKRIHKMLQYMN